MAVDHPDSTLADVAGLDDRTQEWAFGVRRGAAALLTLLVLAALLGLLGVRTSEVSAEEGGWALTARYPAIARAGLDTPWEVTVTSEEGFGQEVDARGHRRLLRPVRDPGLPPRARRQHP